MFRFLIAAGAMALLVVACTPAESNEAPPGSTTPPPISEIPTPKPTTRATAPSEATPITLPRETINTQTLLGPMTWELHDLDYVVTHADSFEDGYVALLYESLAHRPEYRGVAEPGIVATSPDGVVWKPLPIQPGETGAFTPQVLAVDGTRLVVFGREFGENRVPRTDELFAFVWDGDEWSSAPVQAPVGDRSLGGELDIGFVDDGEPVLLRRSSGTWYRSGGGFGFRPGVTDAWPTPWFRFDNVEVFPARSGVTAPDTNIVAMTEYEGRYVAVAMAGKRGKAWTSTNGRQWVSIEPISAPWNPEGQDLVVSPEVIDAGALGWLAVGSWSATGAIWLSTDGVTWGHLTDVPGPSPWDLRVPWPPATVVDDERILIYGRAYDAELPATPSMVWVGTLDG
ncbi:MAG: hypothetical protein BMS9Abin07_0604 [Acidimicrobiia bacterium]|nr:MAG: hypothetical protein BMS9Abin07_0604 [Acidimicrobiia bacterium]